MRALDLKLLRDLWHLRGQALAIALVLFYPIINLLITSFFRQTI